MPLGTGVRTSFSDATDHVLPVEDTLNYLKEQANGVGWLKKVGIGSPVRDTKLKWREVELPASTETVTLADGSGTTLTVADAYVYQANDLIRIENEVVRVTAIASATTLTIVRGYAGTTGAAHAAKPAIMLGSADPENSDAPAASFISSAEIYNYVQTFSRSVELSNDELATLHTGGNPLTKQLEFKLISFWKFIAQAMISGVRSEDTTNKIRTMGGLKQFITTNPTSAGGALTAALIDTELLQIVKAGGVPDTIITSPKQKQKLDALNASLVRVGLKDRMAGNQDVHTFQSGITPNLQVFVDYTVAEDELYIVDSSKIKIRPLVGNGVDGRAKVTDATTPGKDGVKKVIRGKYTMQVDNQKSHSYLYGLT